jgi:hypothetical protein
MRRFSQIATTAILLLLAATPEAGACTFSNGRSLGNGWTVTPCGGGRGGGGGDIDVGATVEGAAAAVQAVGIAVNILGNVLDSMPKASLDMPTIRMPTLPSPGNSMPTMPRPSVSSPTMAPAARQPVRPPDDTAASCARMSKIYKTSHAKMVTATQHLDSVDDNHPDKLCEFGRNVGLPLLQENVNAVYMARGEKCFGEADQKRLVSFRKLLDDENNAIAHDCKRAFEESTAPTTTVLPESSSRQASAPSSSHRAPTVPQVGHAKLASNNDVTSSGNAPTPTPSPSPSINVTIGGNQPATQQQANGTDYDCLNANQYGCTSQMQRFSLGSGQTANRPVASTAPKPASQQPAITSRGGSAPPPQSDVSPELKAMSDILEGIVPTPTQSSLQEPHRRFSFSRRSTPRSIRDFRQRTSRIRAIAVTGSMPPETKLMKKYGSWRDKNLRGRPRHQSKSARARRVCIRSLGTCSNTI